MGLPPHHTPHPINRGIKVPPVSVLLSSNTNIMQLTVIKSTATEHGTYCHKLRASESIQNDILGTIEKRRTYYVFGSKEAKPGAEVELDLDKFNIVSKGYVSDDGQEMQLSYLQLK